MTIAPPLVKIVIESFTFLMLVKYFLLQKLLSLDWLSNNNHVFIIVVNDNMLTDSVLTKFQLVKFMWANCAPLLRLPVFPRLPVLPVTLDVSSLLLFPPLSLPV